ncbi:G patch domain-containing protein 11-like isoform X2 [Acanthaster planci]|uniref:G patch domain-containing protein 11 n=1 Tax=Acanthaster planci TaxID=133434 RepID=A0A8B7YFZ9_ACAPL|nr:G patch domain-containing protein 11-like isoform X2 [Acanthaster planci]
MADEEDDYMSDSFVVESKTTTPGLLWGKHALKKHQEDKHRTINEQHRAKFKPIKEREQEHRLKGLGNALSSQNKGFALLEKMGYKQGMGLGKTGGGRSEPIPVEIKTGRGGLGREREIKDQQERRKQQFQEALQRRAAQEQVYRQDFRQRMSSRFTDKETEKDLDKSQKACEHLDRLQEIVEPVEPWYWPKQPPKMQEDEEEEVEENECGSDMTSAEKLVHLTGYLRRQHRYCIWCGTSFDDGNDLADNCPGDTADDHR